MRFAQINTKDLASGLIFMAVGGGYLFYALSTLKLGRLLDMGPGYFPVVLSGITIAIGLIVAVRSLIGKDYVPFGAFAWRGLLFITLALVFFAFALMRLGFAPTLFFTAFLACHASREMTAIRAVLVSAGISLMAILIFIYGVGLPLPLLGRWFGG